MYEYQTKPDREKISFDKQVKYSTYNTHNVYWLYIMIIFNNDTWLIFLT